MNTSNLISSWGISSYIIINKARSLGFKTEIISKEHKLFTIVSKKNYCKSVDCGLNSSFGFKIANYKELTYLLVEKTLMN